MQITITSANANNIVCNVTPPAQQVITIDRGVAGNGIVSIVPVTISTFQYLRITYTDGTVSDVGPLTSTAYVATAPINITGNTISLLTVPIANGGTGQTTANAAFNALVPSQTGNSGKYLTTDGTNTSWATNPLGTVTSVSGTGTVSGLTLTGTVTTSGSLTLGGTLDLSTYNGAGAFTTLSASSSVTLSGGTANGVAYLNASKVLTTGSALTFDGTTFTSGAHTLSTGNLTFSGTAQRITGDFTNATVANRLMFQTSTVNSPTFLYAIPNGTSQIATVTAANSSAPDNCSWLDISPNASEARIRSGQAGTGTFLPMTFYTGGSERVRIDTSGNVGIGTSSPDSRLNVRTNSDSPALRVYQTKNDGGSTAVVDIIDDRSFAGVNSGAVARVRAWNTGDDTGSLIEAYTTSDGFSTTNPVLYAKLNGNVGIGTSSPSNRLSVKQSADNSAAGLGVKIERNANDSVLFLGYRDNSDSWQINPTFTSTGAFKPLTFHTADAERMRLDTSGNVQIGTTTARGRLHSYTGSFSPSSGNSWATTAAFTTSGAFGGGIALIDGAAGYGLWVQDSGGSFAIGQGSASGNLTSRVFIDSSGNVGIGTSTPAGALDISRSGTSQIRLIKTAGTNQYVDIGTGGGGDNHYFYGYGNYPMIFATNGSERARIDSSGNLLVGTTSVLSSGSHSFINTSGGVTPLALRHESSTAGRYWFTGPDSGSSFLVYNNNSVGMYMTYGGTSWTGTSDERLKTDLKPIENAASKVSSLRAVTGRFKTDEESVSRSFLIAQDVLAVLPEAVDASNPEKLGVAYTDVIPLLVAAIKEQQAQIEQLRAEIQTLKGN